jgi:hypothetical protein
MLNLTTLSQDAANFTDSRLADECSYTLGKIYELEDVFYELQKQLNNVNLELAALEEYNSALSDETERRGWF